MAKDVKNTPNFKQDDIVYIAESINLKRQDAPSSDPQKPKEYVYQGIAAVFGQPNENKRVYEKDEYLPHINVLNDKISRKKLLGELDHPASFEISMQNVSHIIEKLWYDEADNTVKIKVRLMDTPNGRIAMTLADAGVPLAISSRAAGQVLGEGKVKLHKIFTYDLVAEPGFAQAILSPVMNEGLKENYQMLCDNFSCIKNESVVTKLTDVSESYNFGDETQIYKINDEMYQQFLDEMKGEEMPVDENKDQNMSYVTTEEFNGFSEEIKKLFEGQISNLTKQIGDVTGIIKKLKMNEADDDEDVEDADGADGTDGTEAAADATAPEEVEGVEGADGEGTTELEDIEENDEKDEVIRKLTSYVNYMATQINALVAYMNYIGDTLNKSINYSESIGSLTNGLANFSNYLSEKQNVGFNFMDLIAKTLNEGLNHQDYMSNVMNKMINHVDQEVVEKLNAVINFADYIGEQTEKHIYFSNYLKDVINSRDLGGKLPTGGRKLDKVERVVESAQNIVDDNSDIHEQVSKMIEFMESETRDAVLENRHAFLKLLDAENKKKFYTLSKEEKHDIILTMESSIYTTREEVITLMNQVLENKKAKQPIYIAHMPEKYKELWDQMNENERAKAANRAKTYKMTTPYHVKTFWDTFDFGGVHARLDEEKRAEETAKLYEGQSKEGFVPTKVVQDTIRGYDEHYVNQIMSRAGRM